MPSKLTEVPGSHGPMDSGSVATPMSIVSTATEWRKGCGENETEDWFVNEPASIIMCGKWVGGQNGKQFWSCVGWWYT